MNAANGFARVRLGRWFGTAQISGLVRFGIGLFVGITAVTMWQQWALTFGQDPTLLLATSLVLASSCWLEQRWQRTSSHAMATTTNEDHLASGPSQKSMAAILFYLAAWSFIHPLWIDSLTTLIGYIPDTSLESMPTRFAFSAGLAFLGWIVPGLLWSSALCSATAFSRQSSRMTGRVDTVILFGTAWGLVLNATVLSPWLGVFIPTIACSVLAMIGGLLLRHRSLHQQHTDAAPNSTVNQATLARPQTRFSERALIETAEYVTTDESWSSISIRTMMACLAGILLACELRLSNQLLPHGAYVLFVQLAGVIAGTAFAMRANRTYASEKTANAAWGGILAAAAASLLLAAQPLLVHFSLWMNANFATVPALLAVRTALLMAIAFPFGIALALIANCRPGDGNGIAAAAPFAAGWGLATFLLGGSIGLIPFSLGCVGLLAVAATLIRARSHAIRFSIPSTVGFYGLLAAAGSIPLWIACDNPSRTAKLLYSTPAFIAYRTGWDLACLPYLDDIRMIDRLEGRTGPLTLWRGKVAELYVREAGIPRGVVSRTTDAVPQFAPEALQAVYSQVIADRPGKVLLLGLSTGVPLTTCLNFPVREVDCVEGDSNLIRLVRGPLARETGHDPLSDERVRLRQISPELALMARDSSTYDLILSSPQSVAMMEGAPSFTHEFYRRASRRLTDRGLFCQRFECVDFGCEPMQLVLKSMHQAFRKVIAVETTAGEMLLLAANADDVLIPEDLAARLETPHVSKILSQSGLDWCALLNQPAFDDAALREICDESRCQANGTWHGLLAARAPLEVMRWGNKQHEVQRLLTATRISQAPHWTNEKGEPRRLDDEIQLSRRSRLIEWLADSSASQELLRRLGEVVAQQKLVREHPDEHWWKYRKTLRKQLQERPRAAVQVKAVAEKRSLHPEDMRRLAYFEALGSAIGRPKPTREEIASIEQYLEPYDPLVSYFARQELADLLAKSDSDPASELEYRLYVIYFAPTVDASVRNVATAIETLASHPDVITDASTRFDAMNGLIQTLRVRWELRQTINETSSSKVLTDIDKSLVAVEKAVASLDGLAASASVADHDWQMRKQVIDQLMVRPLRHYRSHIKSRQTAGELQAKALIEEAARLESEEE